MAYETAQARDDRFARTRALLDDPNFLEDLYAHIANGGCVTDIAKGANVRYSDIMKWVNADEERKKVYDAAEKARNEWSDETFYATIRAIARVDIRKVLDPESGQPLPPKDWPEDVAQAISLLTTDYTLMGVKRTIKMLDKLKALELEGRATGKFKETIEHTGKVTLADLVAESQKPLDAKPSEEPGEKPKEE